MKDAKRLFFNTSDFSSSEEQTGPESGFREPPEVCIHPQASRESLWGFI